MKRIFAFWIVGLFSLTGLALQPILAQDAPDYQVSQLRIESSADGHSITLYFTVYNKAGEAQIAVGAALVDSSTQEIIVSQAGLIPPLKRGQVYEASLTFDVTRYPAGSVQQIEIVVGRDEIEARNANTFLDNYTVINVSIPLWETGQSAAQDDKMLTIPLFNIQIDLSSEQDKRLLAGIGLTVLAMMGILFLIVRVIVNGAPAFGNWQAPYANMPPLDPNSIYGRRQQWQFHAQNNLLAQPCRPGVVVARKLLLGMDERYLSGWKVKALRIVQYDMYGRVSRSQVLAQKNMVKRLDRLSRKMNQLRPEQTLKRVRPTARRLAKQFKKKINRRSAMLAIALDLRLQGSHGEVRIVFELYDCQRGQPSRIDQWEPEMTVLGKTIYESYTYTLFGQYGGESYRAFRKRLAQDIARALAELLHYAVWPPPQSAPAPSAIESAPRLASTPSTEPNLRPATESQKPKTKPKASTPPPPDSLADRQEQRDVRPDSESD